MPALGWTDLGRVHILDAQLHMQDQLTTILAVGIVLVGLVGAAVETFWEKRKENASARRVKDAQQAVYSAVADDRDLTEPVSATDSAGGGPRLRRADAKASGATMARMLSLYSEQIEQYQHATRARASWSFNLAMVAMLAGLSFVLWGGTVLMQAKDAPLLAAGTILAAVGGAVSAFLAKTFLSVHRLSLLQLNRYFQQPVINEHILMVQRLAEDCGDPDTRRKAYEKIIEQVSSLVRPAADAKTDAR